MQPRLQYLSRLSAATLLATVFFIFLRAGPMLETSLAAGPQVPDDFIIQFVGRYDDGDESAIAVAVQGDYAYIGYERLGNQRLAIVDIANPAQPVQMGAISFPEQIWDIKVSGRYAYVANDSGGLRIVDISDPTAPLEVGHTNTSSATYGVAIADNYVYIADGDNGLRVVLKDPANLVEISSLDTPGNAYDVFTVGNYAYLADGGNGLLVIDISNPTDLFQAGRYFDDASEEISQVAVSGGYAYLDSVRVIDVSYPQNPVEVEHLPVSFCEDLLIAGNNIFVADGYNGLQILDIANPLSLRHNGFYTTDGYTYSVDVAGDYVYLADGQDGLIIVRTSKPTPTPTITPTPTQTAQTAAPSATPTPSVTPTQPPLSVSALVYIPLTLNNHITYFEKPWESEPNNDYQHANGFLRFDQDYYAYPNDTKDYFSVYLFKPGTLTIELDDHTGDGVQMLLYYRIPESGEEVARTYDEPYRIQYNAQAGYYYIFIYAPEGHSNSEPYRLRVSKIPAAPLEQRDDFEATPEHEAGAQATPTSAPY